MSMVSEALKGLGVGNILGGLFRREVQVAAKRAGMLAGFESGCNHIRAGGQYETVLVLMQEALRDLDPDENLRVVDLRVGDVLRVFGDVAGREKFPV